MSGSERKCPACGSTNVNAVSVNVDGTIKFKPVCQETTCRWMGSVPVDALSEVNNAYSELFTQYDKGVRLLSFETVPAEAHLVDQRKRVGTIDLGSGPPAQRITYDTRSADFRTAEDQQTFAAGDSVGKEFHCDNCKRSATGAEMADVRLVKGVMPKDQEPANYYALPAGWYIQLPTCVLVCSAACVKEAR